ncbi:hypothetical protein AQUCO_02700174v1 [Aquilegia coerulea]|uniref:DNA-directed RNA polymerase subunit n=1 Tax=Aquilegia coerulea TaxID=218851 RepID=A0A2G5D5M1_AQUCA|nr:hypothetical protein AQUCO_02700174v1 [Aquilegia coerulea]
MAMDMVQYTKQPFIEDVGPRKIKSINFSAFSGEEIRKAAECQVSSARIYDQFRKPVENGLLDSRMGPANMHGVCTTCHGDCESCPGHFGYIKLCLPVYNAGFFNAIIKILKSICKSCSRILLPDKERRAYLMKMRQSREPLRKISLAKEVVEKCKPSCCYDCGYANGIVKKAGSMRIVHVPVTTVDNDCIWKQCSTIISHSKESKASFVVVLDPFKVLALFRKMVDEDCELLYLSDRPEKLIITDVPVPPSPIRPSNAMDARFSNEDDTTVKLHTIIQANALLQENIQCKGSTRNFLIDWQSLQIEVAQYISSNVQRDVDGRHNIPAKPLRGLVQRLKGKQGRFRSNLSGKRVQYTGRTVISPDPNLKITEVGMPILMAQMLTYPERVFRNNIEKLRQCVRNGPEKYPGAHYITCRDGYVMHLKYAARNRAAAELKYGDIVERHLEDGDVVLFNRQPSLHRMSIMCHRVRVMPWRTLRFNESVCNPYNADFDGDEMNIHVPQTEEARTEALTLMGVQNNLCTPKSGEILVASTQDFLTSSFLITRKDTFYDRADFSLLCSYMGDAMDTVDLPPPALIKPIELWTGKQLFSVLVRPHAHMKVYINFIVEEKNYSKSGETMCPDDGYVYFRNSDLISGQLGKATLGNGNKNGLFSVLLRDYNSDAAASCMNRLAKLSARWIGNYGFSIGIDDVQPGEHLKKEVKKRIDEGHISCDNFIRLYTEGKLDPLPGCDSAQTLEVSVTGVLNNIRTEAAKACMSELHWRNSPLIMSQCGSKGSWDNISQMIACVGQQSVENQRVHNGFIDRSLPHFHTKSKIPAAHGFVANSFYSGMTATEFFFHTIAGRVGLVDTAVKTADTGYMSRRLSKGLEDLSIHYDGTVRNANGGVIQFVYGPDHMDPAKMEGKCGAPLNLERLYLKTKATCPTGASEILSSKKVSDIVKERLSRPDLTLCSEKFKESISIFFEELSTSLKKRRELLHLNEKDSSGFLEKIAANKYGVSDQQLKVFLETCITRYHLKKIEAGTAVGAIGAQSIGEPGTQMTLKTFHFAGVASMNITQGVPRIREIIDAAKNIKTPIITAKLECNNNIAAMFVKGRIEKTVLTEVVESIEIEKTWRREAIVVNLNMETIHDSQLSISADSVKRSILQHQKTKLKDQDIHTEDGRKIIIYLPEVARSNIRYDLHSLINMLSKVVVQGIDTVKRAVYNKDKNNKYELHIEGTNLRAVMNTPGVDGCQTKSSHIIEVEKTLGIEAARKCIIDEIQKTMNEYKMNIDIRHMMLLADQMTNKGEVLGMTRYGVQKMNDSVLMQASFEKTEDHLFGAAYNGRHDNIEGVTECIIMGIPMQMGTGAFKVRQRVEHLPKLTYGMDPIIA